MAAVTVVLAVRARRRGDLPGGRRGWLLLAAVAVLGSGAGLWLALSRDPDVDLPWTWVASVVLASLMPLVVARTEQATCLLWALTVVFPVLAGMAMTVVYAFGNGVSYGGGSTESWATMMSVALVAAGVFVSTPLVVAASLLRAVIAPTGPSREP